MIVSNTKQTFICKKKLILMYDKHDIFTVDGLENYNQNLHCLLFKYFCCINLYIFLINSIFRKI